MTDHDAFIDGLANRLVPVRRTPAVWLRAMLYVPLALILGFGATMLLHRVSADWSSPLAWVTGGNILLTVALGMAAFIGALRYSIADGGFRLHPWMIGALLAWLALAIVSIGNSRNPAGALGQGGYCFVFVLLAGFPMAMVALFALRQTRSIRPLGSLLLASAGVSFLSFSLLAFCHPVAMSMVDFAGHCAAAILIGGFTTIVGWRIVSV